MRILVLANGYPKPYLGSGYVIKNFTEGLQSLGHHVDFFDPNHFQFAEFLSPRANQYRTAIGMYLFLKKQIQQKEYDLIEFYGAECFLAVQYLKKIKIRALIIHHSNGPEIKYDALQRKYRFKKFKWYQLRRSQVLSSAFTLPDGIVTVSEDDKSWLVQHHFPKSGKVVSIPPALRNNFLEIPIDFEKKEKIIGFCGRWDFNKTDLLKEAIINVLKENKDWQFNIIGQPPEFSPNSIFPDELLPQINVIPFIKDSNKLINEFKKVSIFVQVSYYESFGLVLLEAMACGCTVITTNVGLALEFEHKKEAFVLEKKKSDLVYKGLDTLIQNKALRKKISICGYIKAQEFNWDNQKKKLDRIYTAWLKEKNKELGLHQIS